MEQEIEVVQENTEEQIEINEENIDVTVNKDYEELINKPSINNVDLEGNKSLSDLGIDQDFVKDNNYIHTDNNYTTTEKNKLAGLSNYDDTEVRGLIEGKQDVLVSGTNIKTINNESILGSGNITISGGSSIDVRINGTSIISNDIADIITEGTYNASTNKIITKSYVDGLIGDINTALDAINGEVI